MYTNDFFRFHRLSARLGLVAGAFFTAITLGCAQISLAAECEDNAILGITPLNDLGAQTYKGSTGGLYPNGQNVRPAAHETAGKALAAQIKPLNEAGLPDPNGKIVLVSIGMSNASQEFLTFIEDTAANSLKNPALVLVNAARGGQDSPTWVSLDSENWDYVSGKLAKAEVTPNQVQAAWIKQAIKGPHFIGGFPEHADVLSQDLEAIVKNMRILYPNLKIVYLSSRTRSYLYEDKSVNPEPYAFESGFSVKWLIERQLDGLLPYEAPMGKPVAPYLSWGPYLWADGMAPRSDGFVWACSDLAEDLTHPSESGKAKVSQQLLAFFQTDSTTTPWFLDPAKQGGPSCSVSVNVLNQNPLTVHYTSPAAAGHVWTFEDGGFSYEQNPTKIFYAPGTYTARLMIADAAGKYSLCAAPSVTVGGQVPGTLVAAFTGQPTQGTAPLTVQFTDQSSGAISNRLWSFGDGATSSATNPSHIYAQPGIYTVSLTVTGATSSTTAVKANYISVVALPPPPGGGGGSPKAPKLVIKSRLLKTSAGEFQIGWKSNNADACAASSVPSDSVWQGSKDLSGQTFVQPAATTVYSLTYSGAGGSATESVTLSPSK